MKIGIDLDDVILNFNDAMLVWHNRVYRTNYSRKDISDFNLTLLWNCSKEEAVRRIFEFYQSGDHQNVVPVSGALKNIPLLKKYHTLFIITSKPEELRETTLLWLEKYFPNIFTGIIFTNQFHGKGAKRAKVDVCKELGIELFIDDSLDNVREVAQANIRALLFDVPWNQEKIEPVATRMYSWNEIIQKLL